jgi:hypothetical protein
VTGVAEATARSSPGTEVSTLPTTRAAFSVHFTEAYTDASLPGVQVEACPSFDRTCEQPIATVLADEYGLATLFVPGGLATFDGHDLRLVRLGPQRPTRSPAAAVLSARFPRPPVLALYERALPLPREPFIPLTSGSGLQEMEALLDEAAQPAG